MANIDYNKLIQDMSVAVAGKLANNWNEVQPFAEKEVKSFAETIKLIENLKEEGKITEEQAKLYIDMSKSSMRTVLLTNEGLGLLATEAAINAAIDVIRSTVNTAIGLTIL
jgi:hypothetical protein